MLYKLLLADDHQLFIDGLRSLLDLTDRYEVVGEAHTGKEVLSQLMRTAVDFVLLDVDMPDMDGIETTKHIKKLYPDVKVLAISMDGSYETVKRMLKAGADGYLPKSMGKVELEKALSSVGKGQIYVGQELASVLFHGIANRKLPATQLIQPLTRREKEIVALIVEGFTNEEIADRLSLSKATIDTHRKNAMSKLNCKNTAALVKLVIEKKLLE